MPHLDSDGAMYVVGDDVVHCQIGEGAALLNMKSSVYYSLNSVGAIVWTLLGRPISLTNLTSALVERFAVDPDRCKQDVLAILGQMGDAGLIRITNASAD
jgi:hypothetical protein